MERAFTNLELLGFQILTGTTVQGIVIGSVFGVAVCSHGPDGILKGEWRAHVRRGVERPQVVARVYDGQIALLRGEECGVATRLRVSLDGHLRTVRLFDKTYRSSIISKGGRLSNWPSPSSSPLLSPLEGESVGDVGIQCIAPSSGLPRGLSGRDGSPPGEEAAVKTPSDWVDWLPRGLPTFLSRPSTWAGSGSIHRWGREKRSHGRTEPFLELPHVPPLESGFPPGLWVEAFATGLCTTGADWFLTIAWKVRHRCTVSRRAVTLTAIPPRLGAISSHI